jgi:glutamine synthetase
LAPKPNSSFSTASSFGTGPNYGTYQLDSIEGPDAHPSRTTPKATWATAPVLKGGYFPVARQLTAKADLRAEMLATMGEMGLAD